MPAKDKYHDVVVNALIKDDWQIVSQQEKIHVENRRIYLDLRVLKATSNLAVTILIEVKGFEKMASPVDYLEGVVGQYVLYRAIIEETETNPTTLYLAVPTTAYEGILSERIGKIAVRKLAIKIIVFDPEKAEITQWII